MMMMQNKSALIALLFVFLFRRNNSLLAFPIVSSSSSQSSSSSCPSCSSIVVSPDTLLVSSNNLRDHNDARSGTMPSSHGRRQAVSSVLLWAGAAFVSGSSPQPAYAKDKGPPISQDEAFARVQRELQDTKGGSVALLQAALNAGDYAQLMNLSRDMDLSLRKLVMIKAKAFVQDGDAATMVCNAVTFDLIGINRNSRPGQENAEQVQKYIDELKVDMKRMLTLERVPVV